MEFPIAVLGFGVLLLLVGLVGGDLSYSGFVVPKVGPLPRFTTTLTGLAFVLLSVVVYAVEVSVLGDASRPERAVASSSDPVEPDSATAGVEPDAATAAIEPLDVAEPPAEPIVVTIVDQLAPGQAAEEVAVTVEGDYVGGLSIDQSTPVASLDVELDGPGPMAYEVAVEGVDTLGSSYSAGGAATVDVQDGSTLHLSLDPATGYAELLLGHPVG